MKRREWLGLIGSGSLARSPLAPYLASSLGPVKGVSYRLAARIVTSLRTGVAVRNYEDLAGCELVLIRVPDHAVEQVANDIAACGASWRRTSFLLCDSTLQAGELASIAPRCRGVGALYALPAFEGERFVVEGSRSAASAARRLIAPRGRVIQLRTGSQEHLRAAVAYCGEYFAPLAASAQSALREAGLPAGVSGMMLERLYLRTLRRYLKSGRLDGAAARGA